MATTYGIDLTDRELALQAIGLSVYYGDKQAVQDVSLVIPSNQVVALIGPSGCGKSTLLRCFNRMNDLIGAARVEGRVDFHGQDLYGPDIDPVEVRRRIGMVFQKPNPFPKSIYDNVAFGPRVNGRQKDLDSVVEESLRSAALWDEVSDRLNDSAYALSGGQQQRLCIARTLAVKPEIVLMDEPAWPAETARAHPRSGSAAHRRSRRRQARQRLPGSGRFRSFRRNACSWCYSSLDQPTSTHQSIY
jgi:phosphate transport system ATP-binding protein